MLEVKVLALKNSLFQCKIIEALTYKKYLNFAARFNHSIHFFGSSYSIYFMSLSYDLHVKPYSAMYI